MLILYQICIFGRIFLNQLQAHPEFTSKPLEPSAPYLGLILASIGKLETYLQKDCKITADMLDQDSDDDFLSEEFNRIILEDERQGSKNDPRLIWAFYKNFPKV